MTRITREVLERIRAREECIDRFCELWPDGCDVTAENIAKARCAGLEIRLPGVRLDDAALYGPVGGGKDPDMTGVDMTGANLAWADLTRAFLFCARLDRADLRYARLVRAYMSNASLEHSDLRYANMRDAILGGAHLYCADLRHANLRGADFGVDWLSGAKLSDARLSGARYDNKTRWPDGFDPVAAGCVHVGVE